MTDTETGNEGHFGLTEPFDEKTFEEVYDGMTREERELVDDLTRTAASALKTFVEAHKQRADLLNRKWSEMSRDKRPIREDGVSTTAYFNRDETPSPTETPTKNSSRSPASLEPPPSIETSKHSDNVSIMATAS